MNRLRRHLFVRPLEDRTVPATFTVMNLADTGADSLRDCISKANAAGGADTIDFKAGLTGTITLTTSEIAISGAVVVDGPGPASLKISGNGASRIFNTSSAAAGSAITVRDLTLTEGNSSGFGGAIFDIDEALTLINCVFSGNIAFVSGGAVCVNSGGTLSATDCSFNGNTAFTGLGGAVADFAATGAKTVLQRCTISGNTAPQGGGLFAGTYLLVENSTVSGNTATSSAMGYGGGGIRTEGVFAAGALTVRNSTISGNSTGAVGGGIFLTNAGTGTLVVQNCTITENTAGSSGGGIARTNSGSISIESSIVSGNTNATAPDISSAGTVNVKTSAIGSGSGFTITNQGGNLSFQPHANLKLGSLANNGGATLTQLPALDSPLVNAGSNPAAVTTDQRGLEFPRTFGGTSDIGAVEVLTYVVSNVNDSGGGSLRQAIQNANAVVGSNSVTFDPTVFATPQSITLTTGQISITEAVSITGPVAKVTVSGNNTTRIFKVFLVPVVSQFQFTNVILTAGNAAGPGGAIFVDDEFHSLTLENCAFTGNAGTVGGAVTTSGFLKATDCVFLNNSASIVCGAIRAVNAEMRRCTVSGNTAPAFGGMYLSNNVLLDSSTISGNSATISHGGGLVVTPSNLVTVTILNCTISGNTAKTNGGGILVYGNYSQGILEVRNSTVAFNSAGGTSGGGGGIARPAGSVPIVLESSIISKNENSNAPDIFTTGEVMAKNSSIFSMSGILTFTNNGGNQTGMDPVLGKLQDNGGPTKTHALLAGSPCVNAGINALNLTTDQRGTGFLRVIGGQADMGAFEAPPHATAVQINNGAPQRSRVTTIAVTFSMPVTFAATPAAAFTLVRNGDGAAVTFDAVANVIGGVTSVTLDNFTGTATEFGSLADGLYTLTVFASQTSASGQPLDGNGDGIGGDDYVLIGTIPNRLFRLFGDADGNGTVNSLDFATFRSFFGLGASIFDFSNDGQTNSNDFAEFRKRFGITLP